MQNPQVGCLNHLADFLLNSIDFKINKRVAHADAWHKQLTRLSLLT
jgi:hypothetical protein